MFFCHTFLAMIIMLSRNGNVKTRSPNVRPKYFGSLMCVHPSKICKKYFSENCFETYDDSATRNPYRASRSAILCSLNKCVCWGGKKWYHFFPNIRAVIL